MNRIFLAVLALFAGIATQALPAEARVRGETEIGTVLGDRAAARAAVAVTVAAVHRPEAATEADGLTLTPARPAAPAPIARTVYIGPDRAHE
jgi:hypothetical protein